MSRCIKLTRELVSRTRNASVDTFPTRTRDVTRLRRSRYDVAIHLNALEAYWLITQ